MEKIKKVLKAMANFIVKIIFSIGRFFKKLALNTKKKIIDFKNEIFDKNKPWLVEKLPDEQYEKPSDEYILA